MPAVRPLLVALACLGLAPLVEAAPPTQTRFDFDTDAQGWTAQAGGDLVWRNSRRPHGGFLRISDVSSDDFVVVAPASLLGDWSRYLDGTLSFFARNANGDAPDWPLFGQITLSSGSSALTLDIAPDNEPQADHRWRRYQTTLSTAVWGTALPALLGDITEVRIKLEFHNGVSEVVDFDRLRLRRAPR